ncbi:MAG: Nitric oxide reductase [candidate division WS2 bacterium]|uniref:Nitric oxide reductase n=1 Tax=Psychracetigena formicireducens TaxID=2986056 RepID=A0A9E2BJ19_PSYF1|nr:Nitric oxide reductase [Candidatus Psychracetigena formicireducens]MBT9151064.1 Nitric oxide reductase [Candidatus Psychracetigena formicireducens]
MAVRLLKTEIYEVGALDWDRRLFDELIPLPDGTSYNSYLIKGSEKTALIDAVDFTKKNVLINNLKSLGVDRIDYVISHHAEQDHSGEIPEVLKQFPGAKVVTNPKCKELLKEHLLIPETQFITVNDKETISLGDRTLEFIIAPWVHWPETMLTYLREDRILFPCDLFGAHLSSSELFVSDESEVFKPAKRYYAEIMMPFRNHIQKHLERLSSYDITVIAPSHGQVYTRPEFIMDLYKEWVSDEVKNEVVLPYISMHGSVQSMVDYFIEALMKRGIEVKPFNLPKTDVGELAMALVDTASLVVATPTVLTGPHPAAVYATYLANALRPKVRVVSIIGSYGWGGKTVEQLSGMIGNLKVEVLEPVMAKGYPKKSDFMALERLAEDILIKHKEYKII